MSKLCITPAIIFYDGRLAHSHSRVRVALPKIQKRADRSTNLHKKITLIQSSGLTKYLIISKCVLLRSYMRKAHQNGTDATTITIPLKK